MDYQTPVAFNSRNNDHDVGTLDYVAIGVYFAGIFLVAFWSSRKSSHETVDGYFLAGRSMNWFLVGASLFSSNIGSEHFVGLSGSGAASGIGIASFEYSAMITLLLLAWFFLPVYLASHISTMPEYLRLRFGGQRIRIFLSILALLLYIFTKISADLFAGALFIKLLFNIENIFFAILILISVSAFFTIIGGLTTVIWTDTVQTVLMLVGAIYLAIVSISKVNGYQDLVGNFIPNAAPKLNNSQSWKNGCDPQLSSNCSSCSSVNEYYLNLWRPANDPELPWPGIFGIFVSGVWYWCTDQVIVQRVLSAKNLTHAKMGCVFAAALKIFPMFILVIPGMAARTLWPDEIGCSNPDYCMEVCQSRSGCTNMAYPYLVVRLMPTGATGLMMSVILAALMSSLTSIFNSASTIFIIDIYNRFRPRASEIEQIVVGRIFVVALVVVSIIWVPIIQSGGTNSELFHYIQSMTSYLAPPVCAVYVLAVFWPRITEPAAFWTLIVGLCLGMIRLITEYSISAPDCWSDQPDKRPFISSMHYLLFGICLFVISTLCAVIISFFTQPIESEKLYGLTYSTRKIKQVPKNIEDNNNSDANSSGIEMNQQDASRFGDNVSDASSKASQSIVADEREVIPNWLAMICCAGKPNKQHDNDDEAANQSSSNSPAANKDEEPANEHAKHDQDDPPEWANLVDLAAITVILICGFFLGYYA